MTPEEQAQHLLNLDAARELTAKLWPTSDPVPPEVWHFISGLSRTFRVSSLLQTGYEGRQALHQLHTLCRWSRTGMPVLRPTQSLAASLVLSRYNGISMRDVPLPFQAFAVALPRPWLPAPFERLSVLWVHRYTTYRPGENPEMAAIWPPPVPGDRLHEALRVEAAVTQDGGGLHSTFAFDDPLMEDAERWIESDLQHRKGEVLETEELSITRLIRRLVLGLVLYVDTVELGRPDNAVLKSGVSVRIPRKGQPPPPTSPVQNRPCIWTVGRDIKLPRPLRQAAADFAGSRRGWAGRSPWHVAKRFIVRGHFRRVPVGPRAEGQRKWVWVAPFWKGPAEGIELRRTYAVELDPSYGEVHG